MEKKNRIIIISLVLFTVCVIILLIYSILNKNVKSNDALKFRNEYMEYNDKTNEYLDEAYRLLNISEDNTVKYLNKKNIIKKLDSIKGIVFFGVPDDDNSRVIVESLLNKCHEENITIYYLNGSEIDDKLEDELLKYINDKSLDEIVIPMLISIKNKKVINVFNDFKDEELNDIIDELVQNVSDTNEACIKDKC